MTEESKRLFEEGRKLRQELRSHGHYLIVDDSPETVAFFRAIFLRCRTRFDSVSTTNEALDHIKANPNDIQCVVIDLHIPDSEGVGGYRIVEYLERSRSGIPYVVHTGDPALAKKLVKEFPRASVLIKGTALTEIRSSLGLRNENENKNKD